MFYIDSDDDEFCYLYDTTPKSTPKKKRSFQSTEQDYRKQLFDDIRLNQNNIIFNLQGLNFMKFTHLKIKFSFQPNLIYEGISKKYIFYTSMKYLKKYGKWILSREPMPAKPLYRKVTHSVFIRDDIEDLTQVICRIYQELKKWSENDIKTRHLKFQNYKAGLISYVELDSTDEELFLSENEIQTLHKKRVSVLRRMLPPKVI
ncbi:uncharacterized protein LOC143198983 [Rhynchophorus ferrugineus]|uniref:uncharacterized protein LOC143198983 n=1 Tax=Rhynchophorus ferrugineus TaxID=354439 RepID=UPI003FCD0117